MSEKIADVIKETENNKADRQEQYFFRTDQLTVGYDGKPLIREINIQLKKGEILTLIGPNGAGKTTVFNMLTGVYKPTAGTILLDGENITGKPAIAINKAGIARTFQNIRLFKELSVLDNVKVAFNQGMSYSVLKSIFRTPSYWKEEAEIDRKARELLAVFHMEDKADSLAQNLPYGQQRKLEIARALATNPKLLLLDEPAAGMNPTETAELMDTISTIRKNFNISILLIEHDMSLVMSICERLIVIDYGQIIAKGTPYEIANNEKVIGAYLGA